MDSSLLDSTNGRLKIFRKENFVCAKLVQIFVILGIVNNLEMIYSILENVCRLFANAVFLLFTYFMRNLSICRF